MRGQRGYTLPELAVTAVVATVLITITFQSVADARPRLNVRAATTEFVGAHNLARTVAMRYGNVSRLRIDAPGARFWIEVDTTVARTGTYTRIGATHDLSGDPLTMSSTTSLLCFDARGIASRKGACPSGAATLVFAYGAVADTVRTTALGKVIR